MVPELLRAPSYTTKGDWEEFVSRAYPVWWQKLKGADELLLLDKIAKAEYDRERSLYMLAPRQYQTNEVLRVRHRAWEMLVANVGTSPPWTSYAVSSDSADRGKTNLGTFFGKEVAKALPEFAYAFSHKLNDRGAELHPVVYIELDEPVTAPQIEELIVKWFGAPFAGPYRRTRTSQAAQLLREAGTLLVIVDDAHLLHVKKGLRKDAVNHLKSLMSQAPFMFLWLGINLHQLGIWRENGDVIVDERGQIAARFLLDYVAAPTLDTTEGRADWNGLLTMIEEDLRLGYPTRGVLSRELNAFLAERTGMSVGSLFRLLSTAITRSMTTPRAAWRERITREMLSSIPMPRPLSANEAVAAEGRTYHRGFGKLDPTATEAAIEDLKDLFRAKHGLPPR